MSKQEIAQVTLACLNAWAESSTRQSYKDFCIDCKKLGKYWGADETLEESPDDF